MCDAFLTSESVETPEQQLELCPLRGAMYAAQQTYIKTVNDVPKQQKTLTHKCYIGT